MSEDFSKEGGVPPLSDEEVASLNQLQFPYLKYQDNGYWRNHAKCGNQPELLPLFFTEYPATRTYTRAMMVEEARFYCNQCSVRKECFNFAKQNDMRHGVWGGIDFYISSNGKTRASIPESID
jgi:hypothetical protein